MKKLLTVILVLAMLLSLYACAKKEDVEPDNIDTRVKLPVTDEEIDRLIQGNTEIWDYLLVNAPLSNWEDSLERNGLVYYRITDERFDEWSEWEEYVLSVFTREYADKYIFDGSSIISVDGKTYTLDGGRGKDISNNYEIVTISGDNMSVACVVEARFPYIFDDMEGQYNTKKYNLKNTDDGWRIDVGNDNSMFEYHDTEYVAIPGLSDTDVLSDDEIDNLIRAHIRIHMYLEVDCLPNNADEGRVEIYSRDGSSVKYYPVTDERYDTWEEWENYIRAICTSDYAEYWLKYGGDIRRVISVNGRTYTTDGSRGESRNNNAFEIISQHGDGMTEYTVVTKVPLVGEDDDAHDVDTYTFEKTADGWRISGWSVE